MKRLASSIPFFSIIFMTGCTAQMTVSELFFARYLIIIILSLVVLYRLLLILFPRIAMGNNRPSASSRPAMVRKSRYDDGAVAYWTKSDDTVDDLHDDTASRYGPQSKVPDTELTPTLAERFRSQWPTLLVAVLLLVVAIVVSALLFW